MSYNSRWHNPGFDGAYSRLLEDLLNLLAWRVMAALKSKQVGDDWALTFMSIYHKMARIENYRASYPKFASTCNDIVDFYSFKMPPKTPYQRVPSVDIGEMRPAGILKSYQIDVPKSRFGKRTVMMETKPKTRERKTRFKSSHSHPEEIPSRKVFSKSPVRSRNQYEHLMENYKILSNKFERLKEAILY